MLQRVGNRLIHQYSRRNSRTMSISAHNIDSLHPQEDTNNQHRPLVIVLSGPTAVGKSDVAAKLCSSIISSDIIRGHSSSTYSSTADRPTLSSTTNEYRGHVISADSVQAYTKVTIGANKPTLQEMKDTPHHLVNVVNPPKTNTDSTSTKNKINSYNAADWMNDARYVIEKLGCLPTGKVDDDIDEENESDGIVEDEETLLRREAIDKAIEQSLQHSNSNSDTDITEPIILPVVVGGTMMYLNWLCHGRPDAIRPTEEAVQRAASVIDGFQRQGEDMIENTSSEKVGLVEETSGETLEEEGDEETIAEAKDIAAWKVASTYVVSLGPVFKHRVEKLPGRDWYRLRRLLEVAYTIAAKKKNKAADNTNNISEEEILQQLTEKEVYTGIRAGSLSDLGYDVRCFFLCPTDRMTHFHTVDERCEQMLLRGLLRETANLYANGELPDESQVTRAIGYRQTLEYLKRPNAKSNDTKSFLAYIDVFATATRQYAKKQMQWFRRDDEFAFVPVQMDIDKSDRVDNAAQIISDMCKLNLADYKAALSSNSIPPSDDNGDQSKQLQLSAQTKLDNELQGKTMKYFISKRVHLIDGSDDLLKVLAEADECTKLVQELGDEF